LRHIYRSRVDLEKQIIRSFRTSRRGLGQQFPGAKRLTAARLLAWIGDNRDRFPTANRLQATAGTVPVTRRSGKSKSVEFRTTCSHKLRKAADDLARQSVESCQWAQEYYDIQKAEVIVQHAPTVRWATSGLRFSGRYGDPGRCMMKKSSSPTSGTMNGRLHYSEQDKVAARLATGLFA
jgi:hypothetical protein